MNLITRKLRATFQISSAEIFGMFIKYYVSNDITMSYECNNKDLLESIVLT